MIAPDLLPPLIITIVLLLISAIITSFVVYQRWNLSAMTAVKKWTTLSATFFITITYLFALQFIFKQSFEIWLIIYIVTMTMIALGDFIAKRIKKVQTK